MRPAIRIVFAPILNRHKKEREKGFVVHGEALGRTMWLDPRGDILETMVHEKAHIDHQGWTEEEVRAYTKKRLKRMSWKEKARLLKLLGNAILEGEE